MRLESVLWFAWQAISRHRVRSLLALLGVAVGSLGLISIVSLQRSWRDTVDRAFAGQDLNRIRISIDVTVTGPRGRIQRTELTDDDTAAVRRQCPSVEKIAVYSYGEGDVHAGRYRPDSQPMMTAIEPGYPKLFHLRRFSGRFLNDAELARPTFRCMITPQLAKVLYPGQPTEGNSLRLQGVALEVVGTVAEPDMNMAQPIYAVYVPRPLYRSVFHSQPIPEIVAWSSRPDDAVREIDALLRRRLGAADNFTFARSPWLARQVARSIHRDTEAIGLLAALCALVLGGCGVASVLYVVAAESAREVGIRRALGATQTGIALEMLCAGAVFGLAGAAIGAVLSRLGATLATVSSSGVPADFADLLYRQGATVPTISLAMAAAVSWDAVIVAFIYSVVTCIAAAAEPAWEVAGLRPAQAISLGLVPRRWLRLGLALSQVCIAVSVVALLPAVHEALDWRDRLAARQGFLTDVITVGLVDQTEGYSIIGVWPKGWRPERASAFKRALVSERFATKLKELCPSVASVTPTIFFLGVSSVKVGPTVLLPSTQRTNEMGFSVGFVASSFLSDLDAGGERLAYGSSFTPSMTRAKERVCVLDTEAARRAFASGDGVGQTIRVNGVEFRVVGTMSGGRVSSDRPGQHSGKSGGIYMPISSYYDVLPALLSHATVIADPGDAILLVHAKSEELVPAAAQELRDALIKLLPGTGEHLFFSVPTYGSLGEYFALRGPAAKRSAFSAAMLLLIALIGLANMLLVSLGEMRRELGIRRALGARKWQVMLPVITEGGMLALSGSAAGILLAWVLSLVIRAHVFEHGVFPFSAFWAGAACLAMVVAALLVSLIPGWLATRVNPAEALRQE
jgi:ABC-type antimicrobial peptide transport system permease subunit